jgi:hypothetical protein
VSRGRRSAKWHAGTRRCTLHGTSDHLSSRSLRGPVRDDHRGHVGRSVRGREVGADDAERIPALDGALPRRVEPVARRPRCDRGTRRPRAGTARAPAVRPRHARLCRVQPPRLHGARARAPGERGADRRAGAAAHRARPLAPDARAPHGGDLRPAGGRARRRRARDQRGPPDAHRQRRDRLGRPARSGRRLQLRALRARRSEPAGLLCPPVHGADGRARVALARGCHGRRDRDRARPAAVRAPARRDEPAARVPRAARRLHGRADVERRDPDDRPGQHRALRQPDPGDDVRDRDRARLPAGRRRGRRRAPHGRRARREQPPGPARVRRRVSGRRSRRSGGRT